MAPVRRYLRISKYTVLETRIYLDDPSLQYSWLLSTRDPALARVIEAVKPLVLPKLLEERERSSWKSTKKKKSIKDVVTCDEFEVSIFLTETDTRHSVMMKHKHFSEKTPARLQSNTSRLLGAGASNDAPIEVDAVPILQDEEDEPIALDDIPTVRRSKRTRPEGAAPEDDNDNDNDGASEAPPPSKRIRNKDNDDYDDDDDKKKKLAVAVSYQGFAIYGRVLCLVVKRLHSSKGTAPATGQAVMENWLSSTQMGEEAV